MATTQQHIPINEIKNDVVILKDGSYACIIQTSAVNFGLLSENEQLAIISAFAGLLNSLSFMVQIVIRSKRLDISSYLHLLDNALKSQQNPLLAELMLRYRNFIENTISENEVLDKQFFIVIPVSYLELGLVKGSGDTVAKAMTILVPRRDHVIRQLSRIGLKATQLPNEELIKLFYEIYNESSFQIMTGEQAPVKPEDNKSAPPEKEKTAEAAPRQAPQSPTQTPSAPAPQTMAQQPQINFQQPQSPPQTGQIPQGGASYMPIPANFQQPQSLPPQTQSYGTLTGFSNPVSTQNTNRPPSTNQVRAMGGPFVIEELKD